MMEILPIMKGLARPTLARFRPAPSHAAGGTVGARYCYAVWMRHLAASGLSAHPDRVVELGPGLSLGTAVCARLMGAASVTALDAYRDADIRGTMALLPHLAELIAERADIPGDDEMPDIWPPVAPRWPAWLHVPPDLAHRTEAVRHELERITVRPLGGPGLSYAAPWSVEHPPHLTEIDFVFSQAVFEHVAQVDTTYRVIRDWLRNGGAMSHVIDCRSHGMTRGWNGHHDYPAWLWRVVMRGSPNYLNRWTFAQHEHALRDMGYHVARTIPLLDQRTSTAKGGFLFAARDADGGRR